MAEQHEALIRAYRGKLFKRRFKEEKSPMPTFRPDIYAVRRSKSGRIMEIIIVEAEIKSTLFSHHTSDQLLEMYEFIRSRKAKRTKVTGYLLVPKGKEIQSQAKLLLSSLFPGDSCINIIQR